MVSFEIQNTYSGVKWNLITRSLNHDPFHVYYFSCYGDYLELFDGPTSTAASMGRYCGRSFTPISSSQRYLTVLFVTNNEDQFNGFKLYYNFTNDCEYTE